MQSHTTALRAGSPQVFSIFPATGTKPAYEQLRVVVVVVVGVGVVVVAVLVVLVLPLA